MRIRIYGEVILEEFTAYMEELHGAKLTFIGTSVLGLLFQFVRCFREFEV